MWHFWNQTRVLLIVELYALYAVISSSLVYDRCQHCATYRGTLRKKESRNTARSEKPKPEPMKWKKPFSSHTRDELLDTTKAYRAHVMKLEDKI